MRLPLLLREIQIKNFKSHLESKIEFDTGINLIAGRNGSGKSSILEAILVALYGPRPAGLKKNELVRLNSSGYSINLRLDLNGKSVTISRNSNGEAKLSEDRVEGDNNVTKWVEKHICPSHIFTGAIYVRQGEIDSIVRDEKERERIIRKITRIDDYEMAWENLGAIIRMLEREKENYKSFLSQKEELERQRGEKRDELDRTRKLIAESVEKIKKLEIEVQKLDERKRELEDLRKELEDLKNNLSTISGELKTYDEKIQLLEHQKVEFERKIAELARSVKILEDVKPKAERYIELEKLYTNTLKNLREIEQKEKNVDMEVLKLKTELERVREDIRNLEIVKSRIGEIESSIKSIENDFILWENVKGKFERLEEIKRTFEEKGYTNEKIELMYKNIQKAKEESRLVQENFEKLAAKRSSLLTKAKQYQRAIDELKEAEGACPTCGRELDEISRKEILERYRNEVRKIRKELEKLEEIESKLKKKREKLERILEKQEIVFKYKQLVNEFNGLSDELNKVNIEKLREVSRKYEKLKEDLVKLREQEKMLNASARTFEEINRELKEKEEKLERLKNIRCEILDTIRSEGFESFEDLERELEKLKEDYSRWLELRDSERRLEEERRKLERIEVEMEIAKKKLSEKKEECNKLAAKLEELKEIYSEEEYKKVSEEFLKKSKEISGLKERNEILERNIKNLEKDLEYIEKQITLLEEYGRKVEILEKKAIPELSRIREKFRKYRNIIAEAAMKEVERYASEIFEELTEGKYSAVRLKKVVEWGKEKLRVFVVYQGEERDVGFLSGGEMIALGLAFRLALSMFMIRGRIPLLILDEPTPYLDEERRRKLVDITTSYLRKIPQVIIVSHDDELKDAADRVIFVDYHGGASRVRYVETQ